MDVLAIVVVWSEHPLLSEIVRNFCVKKRASFGAFFCLWQIAAVPNFTSSNGDVELIFGHNYSSFESKIITINSFGRREASALCQSFQPAQINLCKPNLRWLKLPNDPRIIFAGVAGVVGNIQFIFHNQR